MQTSHILLEYSTYTVSLEEILIQIKALTTSELKIQATWQVKEHLGYFKTILIPFKTLAWIFINLTFGCSLAPFPAKTSISHEISNFSTYCAPACPLWPLMSKFGTFSKTHRKGGNYHNRGSSKQKFIPEMTTTGAHIVPRFQPCNPNISKVITKRVLSGFFQDPCKTHQKCHNFHNKGGSPLKFIPEVTTLSTYTMSTFQPCNPNINKVIAKSELDTLLSRPVISRPLYTNLGQSQ